MKKTLKLREHGQALVVIALAAVGLFAFAALAIDGSMVFSDRRHAQNAADTAAYDAALAYIRDPNATDPSLSIWADEGLDRAASNGYNNDGTRNVVAVELCSLAADPCDSLPVSADPAEYIQVQITSNVSTFFARVIGISQVTNRVEAVAQVVPSEYDEMFNGNAVVGLAPHDCHAVVYQGNADTTIVGGGIYVMSDCPDSAFFNNSSAAHLSIPSLCSVGGIDYNPSAIIIDPPGGSILPGCEPLDPVVEPNISCAGSPTPSGPVLSPGNYTGTFPPAGVNTLLPGVYCVNGDFRINGGDSLTGIGVTIKMVGGDVRLEGNGAIHLEAPTTGATDGLLIFMPSATNCEEIVFNGTGDFKLVGSVLAPCSNVTINGTGTGVAPSGGIVGQIIGYTVDLSGTSNVSLFYDDAHNYDSLVLPKIKPTD